MASHLGEPLAEPDTPARHFFARASNITAIALYIFIVGLVYNILLRNLWHPEGLQKIADELLHVTVPVAFIIYWVIFAAKSPLRWINAFQWLIYPAIYLVYALIRGRLEGFYPYPFLDGNKLTMANMIINCAGLLVVFIWFVINRDGKKGQPKQIKTYRNKPIEFLTILTGKSLLSFELSGQLQYCSQRL